MNTFKFTGDEMVEFGMLKNVDIREVWANEALHFTPWLVENIAELGQVLGMELEVQEREADVGDFSLDILATDLGSGRAVIIENQLTDTDHDHLGKLLTYAGGFDAGVLVWLAKSIRDEHRKALEWLNENTGPDIDCFGVVIEVIKVDNSKPALNFKPIVFPNEWQKRKRGGHVATSPKGEAYRSYFQSLIDELRIKYKFTGAKAAQTASWYCFSTGLKGIVICNAFGQKERVRVELYIDQQDKEKNKLLFDLFKESQSEIDREMNDNLDWDRLDEKRACRISINRNGSINSPPSALEEIRAWSIENLLKFRKIMIPKLKATVECTQKDM